MECPRCHSELPEVAHFCQRCGQDVRTADVRRRKTFAVKPDEPVASFSIVSTIMPRGVNAHPQTYRLALTIALTVALTTAIFGALPLAVMVAAFAVPIVYIVYLYDVNQWEDQPVPVVALAFGLTFVLGLLFTAGWRLLVGDAEAAAGLGAGARVPELVPFLVFALLVPIVGEAIRQIGPVVLAARPEFDDLMDGLTFGVISGVAFASADTLVKHWGLITGGFAGIDSPGVWASLIFLEGFVKPIVLGTASGIAVAEYSGLGRGYDGFTGRYLRGLVEAVLAGVLYFGGTYLLGFVPNPTLALLLSIGWGLAIAGVLVLRVRNVLHHGLMEAALESEAREVIGDGELHFCDRCEMPLLDAASFCNACGTAVRVGHRSPPPAPTAAAPATTGEETR